MAKYLNKKSSVPLINGKYYYSVPIKPCLVPYIKKIEISTAIPHNSPKPQPYTVLPNVYAVMGIQTSGQLYLLDDNNRTLLNRSGVSGIQNGYRIYQPNKLSTKSLLIRFNPWAVPIFFNESAQHFYNQAIGITEIFTDHELANFEELFFFEENLAIAGSIIQDFLIKKLSSNQHKLPRTNLIALTNQLKNYPNNLSIDKLAKDYGFSKRNLERQFQAHIGLSPKKFALIARFQKVIRHLNSGEHWQNFAEKLGYYDQAHFINEFKDFAGITPTQFMTRL